jgi:hypothetical protein
MDDKEECSICLEDMIQRRKSSSSSDVPNYPNNSNIPECVDLECGHAFHKACLAKWASPYYEDNPTCPVCRTRMTKADIALSCGICRSRAIDVNVAFHNVDERTTIRHDANTEFPYYSEEQRRRHQRLSRQGSTLCDNVVIFVLIITIVYLIFYGSS